MSAKIVLVGGGSVLWTPTLAGDLFLRPGLRGSQLVLVDLDREAAETMRLYCRRMIERLDCGWTVTAATLEAALPGADFVGVSISTGGLEAFHKDYTLPEAFGIYHTTGDTVGPAGISRTLRNVPVFVAIARAMERLCPRARFVHVTNPLSQLTRAVCRTASLPVVVGLCHNFTGMQALLADLLGVPEAGVDAVSVGVNHGSWMKAITADGRPVPAAALSPAAYEAYERRRREPLLSGTTDDRVEAMTASAPTLKYAFNFELFARYGAFPVGSPAHVAENMPFFLNDPQVMARHHLVRKGVLPSRQRALESRRAEIHGQLDGTRPFPVPRPSREAFAPLIEALQGGAPLRAIVALPNHGQVSDLPAEAIVETYAAVDARGLHPEASGAMPRGTLGWTQSIIEEQELAVEAALTGDRRLVVQALLASPMVQNKDRAEGLADVLLAAQRAWLPQFR